VVTQPANQSHQPSSHALPASPGGCGDGRAPKCIPQRPAPGPPPARTSAASGRAAGTGPARPGVAPVRPGDRPTGQLAAAALPAAMAAPSARVVGATIPLPARGRPGCRPHRPSRPRVWSRVVARPARRLDLGPARAPRRLPVRTRSAGAPPLGDPDSEEASPGAADLRALCARLRLHRRERRRRGASAAAPPPMSALSPLPAAALRAWALSGNAVAARES
jgi:hypothetical protein